MPEFFLELFSEEIPARMQTRAAADLERLAGEALAPLKPANLRAWAGARRIALAAEVAPGVAERRVHERGPRRTAPDKAIDGFLRKHGASRADLREEGDFWVLERVEPGVAAAVLIAAAMPTLLRHFPWPKSMRWGGTSLFTWVRPLRRIVALLDGEVVPFSLAEGEDDGHHLASADQSEGHRFLSPGAFPVSSAAQWAEELHRRHVMVDLGERKRVIAEGVASLAAAQGLAVVDDPGLLDEVAGLVEWPVPLLGRIDAAYMDLPVEVMQVSMRVNQRYFALRDAAGKAAPWFAFVANVAAHDGGATIIAGNERVLRARFADARHFWDHDRTVRLESRVAALEGVTFHAKLGSQGARVRRLVALARAIAPQGGADPALAARAALLCKADLTSGMVGEFPELQGVMGGYYAAHDGEDPQVAQAVREHYMPRGPSDAVPAAPVAVAVALADKFDQLAAFFGVGEKPSGSGDPFALRRAALGIVRILRENGLRIGILDLAQSACALSNATANEPAGKWPEKPAGKRPEEADKNVSHAQAETRLGRTDATGVSPGASEVCDFILERLRVQLRSEGARHDVLAAVLAAAHDGTGKGRGRDDDLVRLLAKTAQVTDLLGSPDGADLLTAFRRAANILRIEERKDGPHDGPIAKDRLVLPEERALADALADAEARLATALAAEDFAAATAALAALRPTVDAFFDKVTVNDPDPDLRRNRLRLLNRLRAAMGLTADFSRIEG